MRIAIPGGSGQIGTILTRHFLSQRHQITLLSHHSYSTWAGQLEGCDVCINLAGRSVNCRYHARNRRVIYDSRIQSTQLLNELIGGLKHPPRVWLNASTATLYRHA